jgi:hypothetical protein
LNQSHRFRFTAASPAVVAEATSVAAEGLGGFALALAATGDPAVQGACPSNSGDAAGIQVESSGKGYSSDLDTAQVLTL